MRACFKRSDTLFYATDPLEGFTAILLDVNMQHLKLGCDVLDCSGQPDDGIACFIVTTAESHGAHSRHRDRRASNSSDQLDHAFSLATLTAQGLLATTARA
jgi:hypothetical protein